MESSSRIARPAPVVSAAARNRDASTKPETAGGFVPEVWRLIIDEQPRSGPANMALDQALAEAASAGDSLPTIRFYRWSPPAVSLGRHQSINDLDLEAIAEYGYEVVRRPTGGRAILHTDELTYSVAVPAANERVQGSVMDAYLRLSNALLAGLEQLGVAADKAAGNVRAGRDVSAACFEVPSAYEITAMGKKLIGSAQSRRAGYVLQHGSLPLYGDLGRLVDVLALSEDRRHALRPQLLQHAGTLAQVLDVDDDSPFLQFETVALSMVRGFGSVLHLEFKETAPTAAEIRRTAQLIREQFANPDWTQRR